VSGKSDGHPDLERKVVQASFVLGERSEAYLVQGHFQHAARAPIRHVRAPIKRPKRL